MDILTAGIQNDFFFFRHMCILLQPIRIQQFGQSLKFTLGLRDFQHVNTDCLHLLNWLLTQHNPCTKIAQSRLESKYKHFGEIYVLFPKAEVSEVRMAECIFFSARNSTDHSDIRLVSQTVTHIYSDGTEHFELPVC